MSLDAPRAIVESSRNRLLGCLTPLDLANLKPHLEVVPLTPREALFEAGRPLDYVYFPHSGVICLMAAMRDHVAETAAIGSEGFVGFESILGGGTVTHRALVQLEGVASRIGVDTLRSIVRDYAPIRELLLRYVHFFLIQALQSVACNGLHEVEERCARWLLTAHDRAGNVDTLNLTQDFLAELLGVHRPSVTIVARTLQNAGLIRYSRGVIVITDRKGLEDAACECYGIVHKAMQEILPGPGLP